MSEPDFHPPSVFAVLIASVLAVAIIVTGIVVGSYNSDQKRVETHKNGVAACTTLSDDAAIAACILALGEGS